MTYIKDIKLEQYQWLVTLIDTKTGVKSYHPIPPRENGIDFIDRTCKYHYNYQGIIGYGVYIKIENWKPRVKLITNNYSRIWRF